MTGEPFDLDRVSTRSADGEKHAASTGFSCPRSSASSSPCRLNTRARPSAEPVTIRSPDGENAAESTAPS